MPTPDFVCDGVVPFRILGDEVQTIEFSLEPGDRIQLQPNTFLCSVGGVSGIGVNWGTRLRDPFLRRWSGEAAILQELVCESQPAIVRLGAPQIGKIVRLRVAPGRTYVCQRGAFIASTGDVHIGIAFTRRLRAGLFGGQGFVFQRLSGEGDVFLHALGDVVDWTLDSGVVCRVSTNNILAFEDTISYDIQLSGGLLTLLFGGQGLFLSRLKGPGRALIQSIDHQRLAAALGAKARPGRSIAPGSGGAP